MEKIDAKDVVRLRPLAIAIPSKQDIVLMSHDSLPATTYSRLEKPLCPAYRFCRESRASHRSPMFDSDYNQQITALHDLLQAVKEAAIKLIQFINIEQRRDADPRTRYPDIRSYERSTQSHSPGSGLIATTSSSVCALCGVALHLKDSSVKSRQFVVDKERKDDYDFLSKHLDMILKKANRVPSPARKDRNTDTILIPGSVLDYILSKENDNIDKRAKRQEKVSSKTQLTDTTGSLKSNLLFIRQTPSHGITYQTQDESQRRGDSASQIPRYITSKHKTHDSSHKCIFNISSTTFSTQNASTLTHELLCPCACGLLVRDGIESEASINPMPILKDKLIKTKLEELDLHLDSREITHTKVHDNIIKMKKIKKQKLKKDINVKRWIEEVVQLRLQMQIDELHKNIQFFKQENEYIRCLAEKCRCLSEDIRGLQQLLPIKNTYIGLTSTIKHLQAYHNEHGIIATLTGIFRGSINIQQIATRLLAPFLEHWNRRENVITRVSSASRAQTPSRPLSSIAFNVY